MTEALGRGWLAALPWLVALVVVQVVLIVASDDPSDAWGVALLALLLTAFFRAGQVAARFAADRHLFHGALAALAVLLTWVPVRLAVAVAGDSDRPLAGIGAAVALAVLAGMTGALLTVRTLRRP